MINNSIDSGYNDECDPNDIYCSSPNQYMDDPTDNQTINNGIGNSKSVLLSKLGIDPNSSLAKIINSIKDPLIVLIVSIVISLPKCNRFFFQFFPSLLLESGQITFYGVIVKAIVALVLFVILRGFL